MPVTRGRGKVVPRQALLSQQIPDAFLQISDSADSPGSKLSSSGNKKPELRIPAHVALGTPQQDALATQTGKAVAPLTSADPPRAVKQHTQPDTQSVTMATGPADIGQRWRCTPSVEGGRPHELSLTQLTSFSSSQLLRKHTPVVVRNCQVIACRLADGMLALSHNTGQQKATSLPTSALQFSSTGAKDLAVNPEKQQQQQQKQEQSALLDVLCSPSTTNRFIQANRAKNLPGSYYHVRKPETTQLQMTFTEWLGSWRSWDNSRLLLQALVCHWELKPGSTGARIWPNTAVWPYLDKLLHMAPTEAVQQTGKHSAPTQAASAAAGKVSPINWCQLREMLTAGQYSTAGRLYLMAGGRDALMPARYQTCDRLICQVAGRQRLLLLSPDLAFKGLYPYPVAHPYDGYSCVDWEEPELEHWPEAAKVKGLVCDLCPGDALLVPAYWFVHSQLQQPACVALVLELQPLPKKLMESGGLLLQLSRMVECWLGAEAGVPNIRKWIEALAEGREWQQLSAQISSVKGYKLIRVCAMIMKQLQQVISLDSKFLSVPTNDLSTEAAAGDIQEDNHNTSTARASDVMEHKARQFLHSMCQGRLMPTYWLNEGISDPLYLKYQPQQYVIHEDAEAARYPSLLRHKLIGQRPDWMRHAKPLEAGSKKSLTAGNEQQMLLADLDGLRV